MFLVTLSEFLFKAGSAFYRLALAFSVALPNFYIHKTVLNAERITKPDCVNEHTWREINLFGRVVQLIGKMCSHYVLCSMLQTNGAQKFEDIECQNSSLAMWGKS